MSPSARFILGLILLASVAGTVRADASSPLDDGPVAVGHLNPDSDSIGAAIGAGLLLGARPVRQGAINPESQYLLEYFEAEAPPLLEDFAGREVVILDHNQTSQGAPSMAQAKVVAIIDHHALGETAYVTEKPVQIDIRPWGSTCTILADRLLADGQKIPRSVAGMLLGGLLSDTLSLTGPTATDHDRLMARKLAKIAGVPDVAAFGKKLMEVKSDLSRLGDREVLEADLKDYTIGGKKVGFGVAESIDPAPLLERRGGIAREMTALSAEKSYDLLFFAIVDIERKKAWLLPANEAAGAAAERAFSGGSPQDGWIFLEGVVSRKLQLIPPLQETLGKP